MKNNKNVNLKKLTQKKGISLIVLIVTIISVIILAMTVIFVLSKNNPIESAREARFKEDIMTFQGELNIYISNEYTELQGQRDEKITALEYTEAGDKNSIYTYISSFKEKYEGKVCNRGRGIPNLVGNFPLFGLIDRQVNTSDFLKGEAMIGQIYYAKFYNNDGVNCAYFIPCKAISEVTNADGKICNPGTFGMYDIVRKNFYTNKGSGEFLSGPNVN